MPRTLDEYQTIRLEGLREPGSIRVDAWGVPHIKAGNEPDLFLLQGFNAARDRLWQLDLWRKRGLGLLAADFGPGYLAQDFAARHFLYRGPMAAEWESYAPDARAIATAFATGINAYIDLAASEPDRIPPEFALFGTRPRKWAPEDVVRIRTHALTRNAVSEILRAVIMAGAGAETDRLRSSIEPAVPLDVAPGIDLSKIPVEALKLFRLATAPVTFERERLAATLDEAWSWTEVTDLGDIVRAGEEEGSNNWVVHGSRTVTGRPILASDPHRRHSLPSLRYVVHLTAPGFDAIGAGEPSAPGISIGHNDRTAFGLTIFGADQEDVYVYETRPGAPDFYRGPGGWQEFERIEETFPVKGVGDQRLALCFSSHGPVLYENASDRIAIAVRSVWLGPGSAAYLGSLKAMRAGSVAEFAEALEAWGTPSVNHVCADTSGNIAWLTAGHTPVRTTWHGLLPVPGDGSHEWQGYLAADELPRAINPAAGYAASANEMNLPADRPASAPTIGHEWAEVSRAKRINAVLSTDAAQTIEKSMALQTDVYSRPAEILCGLLDRMEWPGDRRRALVGLLLEWDFRLDAASGAAALFEVWWMRHLRPAVLSLVAPDPEIRALMLPGDFDAILDLLEHPDRRFGTEPEAGRDRMLHETLAAAHAECRRLIGDDARGWAWGNLHKAFFHHGASGLGKPEAEHWDVGPLPIGGSRSTPMHSAYRLSDFELTSGASVRLVMDVGAWDNSVFINTPGQSGDPRSPHYADLARSWAAGEYFPLVYSDARIEDETTCRIELQPA